MFFSEEKNQKTFMFSPAPRWKNAMLKSTLALLICLAATKAWAEAPAMQFFPDSDPTKPFSKAVRIGDMVYVSGVIGVAPDGTLPADFAAQTNNAMEALAAEFKLAGATMDNVFKCDVALADMKNWPAFNTVYIKFFKPNHLPIRMAAGANGLAKNAAVEIECQAYAPK